MDKHVQLLTDKERQILLMLAEGYSDDAISNQMHIPEQSVKKHIQDMLLKQGFVSQYQLISWAYREAIIS